MHRRRRQRILAGSGDQRDALQEIRQTAGRAALRSRAADHLEAHLRHPVAEWRQVEVLEDHIGDAAIGGREFRALDGGDLRIGELVLGAGIDTHRQLVAGDLDPVRPDPADPHDLALAERHGQADTVGEGPRLRRLRRTLARAAARGNLFLELGRPDHLAGDPRAPPEIHHRSAVTGPHQAEPVHPSGLHHLRAGAEQPLVDHPAERRPDGAPDHRGGKPQDTAADAGAHRGTDCREYDRCHQRASSGNAKQAAIRRAQGAESGLSTTPWPV